jgi:competence protein ComEC
MSAPVLPTLSDARAGVREWLALGFSKDHAVDAALLQALMLGDRSPDLHPVERDFQKTGTSHLLSSSGVRMAVLATLVYFICRLFRARPKTSAVIVTLCVGGWGLVTLFTPQGLRPVLVAIMLGIGLSLRRKVDAIQILCFAALAILVVEPLDLYSAGFQFSFVIVLGMLLFTRPFTTLLGGLADEDIEVLNRFGKLTPIQRLRRNLLHHLRQSIAVALVAWAISIPLVAYHFEQVTPWAVPISIVLSPVVLAILGVGFFKLVMSMLIPSLSPTWAAIMTGPLWLLRNAIEFAGDYLPLADIPLRQPPLWAILLFYALLSLPLISAGGPVIRRTVRFGPIGALALILLLGFARQSASLGTVRVTLLSIGAGQCGVVEPPGGGALMVDDGSSTVSDPLHMAIEPFLHHEGKRSLPTIYLSHGDYDHMSATAGAFEEEGVQQVITTPFFRNHAAESKPCKQLLALLDESRHPPKEVVAGQAFDWGGGATAEVLWPTKQCNMNSNNAGMVIRLAYRGKSILFPADIQDPAMQELLKTPQKLRSDVLVAAHHGSSEMLTKAFVSAVNPAVIVSSDATRLTKKQRDFEQMIDHRPLYRTGHCGAITIEIDREGRLRVTPFLCRKQRGFVVEPDGATHLF